MQQQLARAIGLTPQQRTQMEGIRRSFDDDVIAAGRRVRQARAALDASIMREPFDEELISVRADELAGAQADLIRLQARMRARVRGVLTPDQVLKFNELERRMRRMQMEQRRRQLLDEDVQEPSRPPADPDNLDLLTLIPPSE